MFQRFFGYSVFLLLFFTLSLPASAQTAASATVSTPVLDNFPQVEAYLSVHDGQGQFVYGLSASDVHVDEDGNTRQVTSLSELRLGVQLVVAISPSSTFAVRNSQGVSRYDFLAAALENWATSRQGSTLDDLSLVITNGATASHVSDPMNWLAALQTNSANGRDADPDLSTLLSAVDLAADPSPRPGMSRVVLFIAAPVEGQQVSIPLENLASRAAQLGVRIYVWMVTPPGAPITPGATRLIELAEATGGRVDNVTAEQAVPGLEEYLDPLRSIYQLVYELGVTSNGSHQLVVTVETPEEQLTTPAQNYELNIQPPDLAFISPVLEITRRPPEPTAGSLSTAEIPLSDYLPDRQPLQILVDFPDGRARPLKETTLFVDGEAIAKNTQAPFDQFTWDLSGYTTTATHTLQVQAEDLLGMTGSSIHTVVQVTVEEPALNPWWVIVRNAPVLVPMAILLLAAVLLLALLLGGRIHPQTFGIPQRFRRQREAAVRTAAKTAPLKSEASSRHLSNWVNRLQWPQRRITPQALAFLTRTAEDGEGYKTAPIPITSDEVTLGSDPKLATLVLNDLSIDGLHARLIRTEEGSFHLYDQGSIAGTWINYIPVSLEGEVIEHGDLIHVGRVGFRFTLRNPDKVRRPVVTLMEAKRREGPPT